MNDRELRVVHDAITEGLFHIENVLGPKWVLSLVARHRTNPKAHILVSAEPGDNQSAAIKRTLDELDSQADVSVIDDRPKQEIS